jgi:flagellar assembly factor FliW
MTDNQMPGRVTMTVTAVPASGHPSTSTRSGPAVPVVELVRPLLGFPGESVFALVPLDDGGMLYALRSLTDPDLRFLVVPAGRFFPDYAPVVDDAVADDLLIDTASEVLVLLLLTAGSSLATTTANLLAPVLLNVQTCRAAQVVLDDPALSLHAPLVA